MTQLAWSLIPCQSSQHGVNIYVDAPNEQYESIPIEEMQNNRNLKYIDKFYKVIKILFTLRIDSSDVESYSALT